MTQQAISSAPLAGTLLSTWSFAVAKTGIDQTPYRTTVNDISSYVTANLDLNNYVFNQIIIDNPSAPADRNKNLIKVEPVLGNLQFSSRDDALNEYKYLEVTKLIDGKINSINISVDNGATGILNQLGTSSEFVVADNVLNPLFVVQHDSGNATFSGELNIGTSATVGTNLTVITGDFNVVVGKAYFGNDVDMFGDMFLINNFAPANKGRSKIAVESDGEIQFNVLDDTGLSLGKYLEVTRQIDGKINSVNISVDDGATAILNQLGTDSEFVILDNNQAPLFAVQNDSGDAIFANNLLVSKDFQVISGNLNVTSGNATISGFLNVTNDYISNSGNMSLTNGNITLGNGDFIATNGNLEILNGNITATAGHLTVQGNITSVAGVVTSNTVSITGSQTPAWTLTPPAVLNRTFNPTTAVLSDVIEVFATLLSDLRNNGGFIS